MAINSRSRTHQIHDDSPVHSNHEETSTSAATRRRSSRLLNKIELTPISDGKGTLKKKSIYVDSSTEEDSMDDFQELSLTQNVSSSSFSASKGRRSSGRLAVKDTPSAPSSNIRRQLSARKNISQNTVTPSKKSGKNKASYVFSTDYKRTRSNSSANLKKRKVQENSTSNQRPEDLFDSSSSEENEGNDDEYVEDDEKVDENQDIDDNEYERELNHIDQSEYDEDFTPSSSRATRTNSKSSKNHTNAGTVDEAVSNVNENEAMIEEEKPKKRSRSKKVKEPTKTPQHWHPELITVWDELAEIEKSSAVQVPSQPDQIKIKLLPFQLEGLGWLQQQEESRFNGGILADEMGMGKTIQMISLLVTKSHVKPNLILCPTVAILQWFAELQERTTPGLLKVLVFHGNNRSECVKEVSSYDVVLSTYSIVESGFRKQHYGVKRKGILVKQKSIIHNIEWGRVVLDEAHAIKDRSCSTARAVFALNTSRRWSLSGTPLQNRVGELYSLIRFMDADPFSNYFCKKCPCKMNTWSFSDRRHCDQCGHISHSHFCWWNAEILKPIQKYGAVGDGAVAFKKLGMLLDRIMLRRTKIEKADDLGLPPRIVQVRRDVFNEAEEEFYESLYSQTSRQFNTYVEGNTVLNNYATIFSLLSRMRLAVNHPDLVTVKLSQKMESRSNLVCGICSDLAEDAIAAKCKHVFCREDVRQYIESAPDRQDPLCPVCFKVLTIDLTQPELEEVARASDVIRNSIVNKIDFTKWRSSTKIEALVEELTALQKEGSTEKSIVFSQFVAFLDLIQWRLSRAGFSVVKLDGRMSPQQRDAVIKSFMTDPTVTVFLVSLKAGGVALNLTEASRVFVMDPWWNPAVEDQAFDRIHRLGQTRPIKIKRMIIENSIESRILQLQEKKKALFQSTVGKDMEALAKLSEEDLQFLFVL